MNLNSSPSPFPMHQDNDHHYLPFGPNQSSCHFFFNSTQDHNTSSFYDHRQFNFHPQDENYDYQGGSTYEIKNKVDSSLKLTLWKKEDHEGHNGNNTVKWMSSKMRVMEKMKNEDRNLQRSPSSETEMSSNSSSYNNNMTPIRVCSDCNTTKTPLWRSGPKGPKSLCNACGIRQRKARRAMAAAAAAAASGPPVATIDHHQTVKIKVQHKDKKNGHSSQLKKRLKTAVSGSTAVGSPSNGKKKIGFEDFLINISNNLAFHRVFPEDEKDAAILLMALSSGLVNG